METGDRYKMRSHDSFPIGLRGACGVITDDTCDHPSVAGRRMLLFDKPPDIGVDKKKAILRAMWVSEEMVEKINE